MNFAHARHPSTREVHHDAPCIVRSLWFILKTDAPLMNVSSIATNAQLCSSAKRNHNINTHTCASMKTLHRISRTTTIPGRCKSQLLCWVQTKICVRLRHVNPSNMKSPCSPVHQTELDAAPCSRSPIWRLLLQLSRYSSTSSFHPLLPTKGAPSTILR